MGGHAVALDACCREAIASGATGAVKINVSIPSHTKLMAEAVQPLLRQATLRQPRARYRLLSGLDGGAVADVETGRDKLARQICSPVEWAACLESCREAGVKSVLELGPGSALSRMAAARFPAGRVCSAEEFRTVAGLLTWLLRD